MNDQLDQHEDGGTKAGRDGRCHTQACEDSSQTFSVVPAPLDLISTGNGNANTSNGRDEGVGGRDVGRVTSTPHDPRGCRCEGAGEGEHLNARVAVKCSVRDDAVLDSIRCAGTHCNRTQELEDSTEYHSLPVGDGP